MRVQKFRRAVGLCSLVWTVGVFLQPGAALGEERRYLVILANSPKTSPDAQNLPSRTAIDRQYFDRVAGNGINSFAEYWEEISYGDISITGETEGWIDLPWALEPLP